MKDWGKRRTQMKTFIICPVRDVTQSERDEIRKYVLDLERQGVSVHWPERDTNQDDKIGNNICKQNKDAILSADRIYVYYNPKSAGTLFDLGIAWAVGKPMTLINKVEPTDGSKSFNNVLLWWNSWEAKGDR